METIQANGLTFAYLEDGPADGPLALCLHGFPDSAHSFRHLLPALGAAGFHAVAPFMRGYAPTEVPADGQYQTGALVRDANALHDALGGDGRAVLVGHDWGATAVYGAAVSQPDRWRRVVTAAVPPLAIMGGAFMQYDQLHRSWYMFFFQNPLADVVVPMNDLEFIDRLWADWSPGYDASEDLPHVKDCLRKPENLAAALGYYRAMFAGGDDPEGAAASQPTPQPTLYLHGATDGCIGAGVTEGAENFLGAGSKKVVVEKAGHFLQVERPDVVNKLIVDWATS